MIWDPRFDDLDPYLCLQCEELEVLKDGDLCIECILDDERDQQEAEVWAHWAEDPQAEEALLEALARQGVR